MRRGVSDRQGKKQISQCSQQRKSSSLKPKHSALVVLLFPNHCLRYQVSCFLGMRNLRRRKCWTPPKKMASKFSFLWFLTLPLYISCAPTVDNAGHTGANVPITGSTTITVLGTNFGAGPGGTSMCWLSIPVFTLFCSIPFQNLEDLF